jgi:parvulin-like peptidyl-prolyl isomerase
MRRWIPWLAFALLCGCQKSADNEKQAPLPENAVARVGSEIITIEDFQEAMRRRPAGQTQAARDRLLDELVQFRLLVQKAKDRGYDRDPKMLAAFDRMLADRVREEEQSTEPAQMKVTPEEIGAYYQAHLTTFHVPAKIRVAEIFVEAPANFTEEKRAERRAKIDEARAKASGNASPGFGPLAAEYSFDQATKYKGGDLGYLVEGMNAPGVDAIEPAVFSAAFALSQPGQLSDIIATPEGFYLLKLTERYPASTRPLAEVKEQIALSLQREKNKQAKESHVKEILADKTIELRRDRLASIPAPSPERPNPDEEPPPPPAGPPK